MMRFFEHFSQPAWRLGTFALETYFEAKTRFDGHIVYTVNAWLAEVNPLYRYHRFVGVLATGLFGRPLIRVEAIHIEATGFAMSEVVREFFIPAQAFQDEACFRRLLDRELQVTNRTPAGGVALDQDFAPVRIQGAA